MIDHCDIDAIKVRSNFSCSFLQGGESIYGKAFKVTEVFDKKITFLHCVQKKKFFWGVTHALSLPLAFYSPF